MKSRITRRKKEIKGDGFQGRLTSSQSHLAHSSAARNGLVSGQHTHPVHCGKAC